MPASEPLLYRRPISTWWWTRKRTYFVFVMRELSSIFVAWFVVFLLLLLRAVDRGAGGVRRLPRLGRLARGSSALNVVAVAFLVLHTVTWFSLTPQAMAVRVRGRPVPPVLVIAVAVRRAGGRVRLRLLAGDPMTGTRARIEPLVWLMFSGGGVIAAVFLPVLVFLFALRVPARLDRRDPTTTHLLAVASHPLTVLVLFGPVRADAGAQRAPLPLHALRRPPDQAEGDGRGALLRRRLRRLVRGAPHPHRPPLTG